MKERLDRFQAGDDPVFYDAPAVIVIHTPELIPTPQEDCLLAGFAMVAQYNGTNTTPLTDAEQQALPLEMVRVPLHWIGEASLLPDPTDIVLDRAEQVALARWIASNTNRII